MIDLLILTALAVSLYIGWKQGIVRGCLTLIGTILSLIIASQIADFVSSNIVEQMLRPAAHTALADYIQEIRLEDFALSPRDEVYRMIQSIENDLVRSEAAKFLDMFHIPTEFLENTTREMLLSLGNDIVDTVLRGTVRKILSTIIYGICFAILSLALHPIIWTIDQAFRLPLLRQVNQIGGMLFGGLKGILLILIAIWILHRLGLWITDDMMEQSSLIKIISQFLNMQYIQQHLITFLS